MLHSFRNTLTAEKAVTATTNTQESGPMSGLSTTMEDRGGRLLKGPIRPDNCHQETQNSSICLNGESSWKGISWTKANSHGGRDASHSFSNS